MGEKKFKVLIVTAPLNIGGFDIVATNLQKNLDKDRFECTYCVRGEEVGVLEPEVIKSGARVIHQPDHMKNYFKSYIYYKKLFRQEHFDAVHSHLMFYSGIVMRAAYKAGVKKRIPHSHMTDPCIENRSFLKRMAAKMYSLVMKHWMVKYGTDLIACGPEAGDYLYGKKAFAKKGRLLNNGTYLDKFSFNEARRANARQEFHLQDKIVLGHVGHLNYVKNHLFLVDVFNEFQKRYPDSHLLIVGYGEEQENIEKRIHAYALEDKITITGMRTDVENLLCAMDCFVFPSIHEGLPMTLIEAQATKLACVISDRVSRYAKLNDNVVFLSLDNPLSDWADAIEALLRQKREDVDLTALRRAYDIHSVARTLEEIYLNEL